VFLAQNGPIRAKDTTLKKGLKGLFAQKPKFHMMTILNDFFGNLLNLLIMSEHLINGALNNV
jgi:hypothetical protein